MIYKYLFSFLFPMNFSISFEIYLTTKLSKYDTLSSFTYKAIYNYRYYITLSIITDALSLF